MRSLWLMRVGLAISIAHFFIGVADAKTRKVEDRLTYLEQVIENHTRLLEQSVQVNALQEEIRQLRGMIEVQGNEIKLLQQQKQPLDQKGNQNSKDNPPSERVIRVEPNETDKTSLNESNTTVVLPTETLSTVAVGTEEGDYQTAYQLLQNKQYVDAIVAFENFQNTFPKSKYVASAYYWLGETYFVQWQAERNNGALLGKAEYAFSELVQKFPMDLKTPDALLKLGIINIEKQQKDTARQYFLDLKKRFPTSSAARLADTRLKRLQQEEAFLSH